MKACAKCGREVAVTFGAAGWCRWCEEADIALVVRRDVGVSPRLALEVARVVMERDTPPARAS